MSFKTVPKSSTCQDLQRMDPVGFTTLQANTAFDFFWNLWASFALWDVNKKTCHTERKTILEPTFCKKNKKSKDYFTLQKPAFVNSTSSRNKSDVNVICIHQGTTVNQLSRKDAHANTPRIARISSTVDHRSFSRDVVKFLGKYILSYWICFLNSSC